MKTRVFPTSPTSESRNSDGAYRRLNSECATRNPRVVSRQLTPDSGELSKGCDLELRPAGSDVALGELEGGKRGKMNLGKLSLHPLHVVPRSVRLWDALKRGSLPLLLLI